MGSDAEEFKETLRSFKEFHDGNGGNYLIMQFEDDSGLVFEKESSDGDLAIAELSPLYRGLIGFNEKYRRRHRLRGQRG